MQKFLVCVALVTLLGSQALGEAESNPREDSNSNPREVIPLDQVQTKPWQSPESYPTYATNSAPFPYAYYGGYPQGNQMVQPRMMGPQTFQPQTYPQVYQTQTQPLMYQPQMYQSLAQPQMYQPLTQPQPQAQMYPAQPLPYPMQQQFQQLPWQPTPENYGPMPNMDISPQTETGVVEPVETPMPSQIWAQPSNSWESTNGVPTWKRSYTPLPGQSGCFNRCKPSCNPNSCQSTCQSACNIRPTCGRRGQVSYNGSTMICGRPGFNQSGVWPEVKPWQDYQNPWEQSISQGSVNTNGLQASSVVLPSSNDGVQAIPN